jgi:TolB-like protein
VKRCPQCNRIEADDTLAFCRTDGVALVNDSGSFAGETETAKFGSGPMSSEIETSLLPHTSTTPELNRNTGPTTALPAAQLPGTTRDLTKPNQRKFVLATIGIALVVIFIVGYFYLSRSRTTSIQSIAVMPFVNESGNADVEYLSDGMTETLISSLSQLPNLNVKARSSVFRYKGKETNPQTIGKELNVQAILNGRVSQRGGRLTLSLELIDAQTENVIWSEQYNRGQADLVSLQSEIARDVSSKLKTKLSGADVAKVEKNYTANAEAYQLYLKGKFYWNKRTGESLKQAAELYRQAIEKDPN